MINLKPGWGAFTLAWMLLFQVSAGIAATSKKPRSVSVPQVVPPPAPATPVPPSEKPPVAIPPKTRSVPTEKPGVMPPPKTRSVPAPPQSDGASEIRSTSSTYSYLEFGFLPSPLMHISLLDSWGAQRQHLAGPSLSLIGPLLGLGATYRYYLPSYSKLQLGVSALLPLQNLLKVNGDNGGFMVGVATIQYAISPTFGLFVTADSNAKVSAGMSFYNPLWFPLIR